MEGAQMVEEIFRLARKKHSNSGAIARLFDTAKRKIYRLDVRMELISASLGAAYSVFTYDKRSPCGEKRPAPLFPPVPIHGPG